MRTPRGARLGPGVFDSQSLQGGYRYTPAFTICYRLSAIGYRLLVSAIGYRLSAMREAPNILSHLSTHCLQ